MQLFADVYNVSQVLRITPRRLFGNDFCHVAIYFYDYDALCNGNHSCDNRFTGLKSTFNF